MSDKKFTLIEAEEYQMLKDQLERLNGKINFWAFLGLVTAVLLSLAMLSHNERLKEMERLPQPQQMLPALPQSN